MWEVMAYGRNKNPRPLERARFEQPFVLISIADEGENWERHIIPDSQSLVESLLINFHEHSPLEREGWSDAEKRAHRCFSARDASKILDLLTRRLPQVKLVVVVCQAGQYRSIAIARGIAKLLGASTDSLPSIAADFIGPRLLWHAQRKHWQPPVAKNQTAR